MYSFSCFLSPVKTLPEIYLTFSDSTLFLTNDFINEFFVTFRYEADFTSEPVSAIFLVGSKHPVFNNFPIAATS